MDNKCDFTLAAFWTCAQMLFEWQEVRYKAMYKEGFSSHNTYATSKPSVVVAAKQPLPIQVLAAPAWLR